MLARVQSASLLVVYHEPANLRPRVAESRRRNRAGFADICSCESGGRNGSAFHVHHLGDSGLRKGSVWK